MKKFRPYFLTQLFAPALLVFVLLACKEDDPTPSKVNNEANQHVNAWILDNMEYWYLWNEDITEGVDKNLSPDEYFDALLTSDDRFSWIQDDYQELLNSLKGVNKEAGFEYIFFRDKQDQSKVIAQVTYIKAGSPAETAGLVRGDIVTHINDQQLTLTNYRELSQKMKEPFTILYKSADVATETFSAEKSLSLTPVEFTENPNFLSKVIEVNDHKIGYYVYNFFATGPAANDKRYDDEMDQVFANFKSAGITDLVVDLRFNSGGSELSAINLSSLIGTGVNTSKVFATREYNEGVTTGIKNDPELGEAFLTKNFASKSENIGSQLQNNRVYVLTTSRSASASELVINALKPYMDVFIVGDTTYGKNVGSISLYDEDDPKNTWGMQPIVVKIFNSLKQSDYSEGFAPNVMQKDNSLFIYPLGDEREVLLAHAIGQITGTSTQGRAKQTNHDIIGYSLDNKRSSFNLIIDLK